MEAYVEATGNGWRRPSAVDPMVAAMPVGLYVLDADWRFSYVNAEAEKLIGRGLDDVAGQTLWEAFPAAVGSEIEESYRAAVASGESVSFETYYPEPLNGWYDVRAQPVGDGLAVYFLEITDRRRAQERAHVSGEQLALLAQVSNALAGTLTTDAVTRRLPALLVPTLAHGCIVTVLDDHGHRVRGGAWHIDDQVRARLEASLRKETARRRSAAVRSTVAAAAGGSVVVPISRGQRALGELILLYSDDRSPSEEELASARDIADRAGLALDSARLYGQQRRLAQELQRSLLTDPPEPQPEKLEIAVRYLPATEAAAVGGDWYDAFHQADGSTVLIIGDVVGHDIAAAATMGQLRGITRGIATCTDAGPAAVLSSLDRSMELLRVDTLATAAIASFTQSADDQEGRRTRMLWSSAGHPPPLLVSADGEVSILDRPAEIMLGVDAGASRTEAALDLHGTATVLLYTDGLVERRDADLDAGLERLRTSLAELAPLPLEELCDQLLERLVQGRPSDDVALVAVRLYPARR